VVICLERDADLHTAQLMPLPLTVSCFSKIQISFTFLVPTHPGSPGKRAVKRVYVCIIHTHPLTALFPGLPACLHMVQLMPLHPKTLSSLASFKSRLALPFWYRITQVVRGKKSR